MKTQDERPGIPLVAMQISGLLGEVEMLQESLKIARDVIRSWHGGADWELYNQHSPEMNRINMALAHSAEVVSTFKKEILLAATCPKGSTK